MDPHGCMMECEEGRRAGVQTRGTDENQFGRIADKCNENIL